MGENRGLHNLTPRERECLRLVSRGLSTHAIAFEIDLSWHTVDAHIRSARGKLGGISRAAAADMLARAEGTTNLASKRLGMAGDDQTADDGVPAGSDRIGHTLRDSATPAFELMADWTGTAGAWAKGTGDADAKRVHRLAWTAVKIALGALALVVLALSVYGSMSSLVRSLGLRDMPPGAKEGTVHAQPTTGRRTTRS